MAEQTPQPQFCPFCGKPRANDASRCPSCGSPAIKSVLADQCAPCPITCFGEDVPTLLFDEQTGEYFVNPAKTNVKWQWIPAQVGTQFPFTLAANARQKFRVPINAESGGRGAKEIFGAIFTTDSGRIAAQITIPVLNKTLSNGLVPTSLMSGTAQLPGLWPMSVYAQPTYDWTLDVQEIQGTASVVSPVFFGRTFLDPTPGEIEKCAARNSQFMHPFWLVPTTAFDNTAGTAISPNPTVTIPALSTVTATFTMTSDAYLDVMGIVDDSSVGLSTEPNQLFVSAMIVGGSGRNILNVPRGSNGYVYRNFVASPTVGVSGFPTNGGSQELGGVRGFSSGGFPSNGQTFLLEPGASIDVVFVNTDDDAVVLRTAFFGNAIYAGPPPALTEGC